MVSSGQTLQPNMTTTSPPRRNWHFNRWLIVFIVAVFGWSGWRAYAFHSALAEARALGWRIEYTEPSERIRKNWKAAFKKETWLDGVTELRVQTSGDMRHNLATVTRLNPRALTIQHAAAMRDLSALQCLTRLQKVALYKCTRLINVDALKNHSALQSVALEGCTDLTNVDALNSLSALRFVKLTHCKALTNLDGIKNLPALLEIRIFGCDRLTNVDALKSLPALQKIDITACDGLTNLDALKNLSTLQSVQLHGSTGITKENVAALKAALPNVKINDR